jgi:hypothetical protein
MPKRLSLCLLQTRVRSFEISGFHTTVEHRRPDRRAMHPPKWGRCHKVKRRGIIRECGEADLEEPAEQRHLTGVRGGHDCDIA